MVFTNGQSVIYNSKYCTIFRVPGKRLLGENSTGYLIKENSSNITYDNVQDSEMTLCDTINFCNEIWNDFTYTGDNKVAFHWIINYLIKQLNNTGHLEWGNNSDNTEYFFKINGITLTKNKTD